MVVFDDVQCPFCKVFEERLHSLESTWIRPGKLKIEFRDYPIFSHRRALSAHRALGAAQLQGKYQEMRQALFAQQERVREASNSDDQMLRIAKEMGLSEDQFLKDYQSPEVREEIAEDQTYGRSLGVHGTPAIWMNGQLYSGALSMENLQKILQEAEVSPLFSPSLR